MSGIREKKEVRRKLKGAGGTGSGGVFSGV